MRLTSFREGHSCRPLDDRPDRKLRPGTLHSHVHTLIELSAACTKFQITRMEKFMETRTSQDLVSQDVPDFWSETCDVQQPA